MDRNERKLHKHFAQQALGWTVRKERQKEKRLQKSAEKPAAPRPRMSAETPEDWDEIELPQRERFASRRSRPSGANAAAAAPRVSDPAAATAVVLGVAGGWVRLWRDGTESRATLPGRITTPLAPGDEVTLDGLAREPRIAQVLPRRSVLMRPDPHVAARGRILATNVDTVVIVVAGGPRAPRAGLVDRLLLAVERAEATPVLCVSKMDLAERRDLEIALAPFLDSAVRLVTCSARTGESLDELGRCLQNGRAVLVGQSGAGKTTLLNALVPGLALATTEVREHDGKGRHTTSAATLVELPGGGQVLDTPGVRQFGLWAIGRGDLDRHFAEIAAAAADCRFRDCLHGEEPDCAVRTALAADAIDVSRYASYRRLLAECEPGA